MEHVTDTDIALISLIGTFLVSFAIFIWWIANKFFGLKISIDGGFYQLKEKMNALHNQNVERFHQLENRISILERRRGHGV
jgi:hypothetical protein